LPHRHQNGVNGRRDPVGTLAETDPTVVGSRRYADGMRFEKLSITMDPELTERAKDLAEQEGKSLSAWISELVADAVRRDGLRQWIDEWQGEHGRFTEDQMREARIRMGYPSR
jgi:hypothetical protein